MHIKQSWDSNSRPMDLQSDAQSVHCTMDPGWKLALSTFHNSTEHGK